MKFGIEATVLPSGERKTLWVADGKISEEAKGSPILLKDVWVMPGLVDAHCHIGLAAKGPATDEQTIEQAITDRDTGVLLVRDTGVPRDTHFVDRREDLPRIIRSGQHVARYKRYIRNYAVEVEPEELVDEVARQASKDGQWVKIVGDWIDRELGDLAPLWPADVVKKAVDKVHELGKRVQVHTFGEEAVADFVAAGADCIEHGTGLSDEAIEEMAETGIALVPTMTQLATFPELAAGGDEKYPTWAAHMRALHKKHFDVMGKALEAGVQIYAGTDAGGRLVHGRIAQETDLLAKLGGAEFAAGAASWRAREWLGAMQLEDGDSADFACYREDPRKNISVLHDPKAIVLRGKPVKGLQSDFC